MGSKSTYPRFYPVECPHGHDCCPICDAETLRADAADRVRMAQERAERFMDPFAPTTGGDHGE